MKEIFYANLHSMIIPLYGFKSFHHVNRENTEEEFIGRQSIIDKLSSWLKASSSNYTGAYLITGYRGMGKSSFVYKAIKELKGNNKNRDLKYVPVTINVGNELLETKDLLAMICKLSQYEFDKAIRGIYWSCYRFNTIMVSLLMLFVLFWWGDTIFNFIKNFNSDILKIVSILLFLFFVLFIGAISNKILYIIWKITNWDFAITIRQIKNEWNYLIERINAELTLSTKVGSRNLYNLGMFFKYGKTVAYPIADVPEMQEMLVKLLELVYKHKFTKLRFIFIIDELDKIFPKNEEKMIMPEYISSNIVNGDSTYHSRQKMLVSLIANMKYFISSSKAKFIFVTGYDMYEATLSDISNREFNIHSIFNGQINVSSFFRKTGDYSGIDSMMEQYLCNLLIGKKKGRNDTSDNITLKSYSIFHENYWKDLEITEEQRNIYRSILERRIVFLNSFLTYLVYVSNGSPKKLAIYIEKNIRTKRKMKEKLEKDKKQCKFYDIHLGLKEECEYYLYFDSRNLMKICFVNYLIYPMIQNLVNKSNIYNDKLLVATSFMLSNLYKFHKSGFSMRNLEYMPELLDINKMPELRDFIGGIVEFLTQTHMDEAIVNLYKYKFPLRLSEEITYFSKTSEEISYLFNFSHDELLSVKNLYMMQLEHYNGKYEAMGVASLHHMLGDIYMLEEDYEQAIYEFQEALSAVERQRDDKGNMDLINTELSKILFIIRVSLKLGLAYEKRKTFDTAYLSYQNLIWKMLNFVDSIKHISSTSIMLDHKMSLFYNIRIVYLAPLAKLFVLEKMDLGGFTQKDIKVMEAEVERLRHYVESDNRPLIFIDFYSKFGDILYYRNIRHEDYVLQADNMNQGNEQKNISCKCHWGDNNTSRFSPCAACTYYNRSIYLSLEKILNDEEIEKLYNIKASKSLFFLEWLFTPEKQVKLLSLGYTYILAIANALVGMGNCLLGCGKENFRIEDDEKTFFVLLLEWIKNDKNNTTINISYEISNVTSFMKSVLYYWAASKAYALIGEYKSAYNMNCQILESIYAYYRVHGLNDENSAVIDFCEKIVDNAIQYAFEHYEHINSDEVNKLKSDLNIDHTKEIKLDYLSNFPDIEIAIYKYYQICFLSYNNVIRILRKVVNSRQLGSDKIISSFTQNIHNLDFKEKVNEQILFLLMPNIKTIFENGKHTLIDTISIFKNYFRSNGISIHSLTKQLGWNIFDDSESSEDEKRFLLIQYLISDSMFCLNKIIDLLTPLYSTTLYSNEFIGSIYEKLSIWDHLLIIFREILSYIKSKNRNDAINSIIERYSLSENTLKDLLEPITLTLENVQNSKKDIDKLMYSRIRPNSDRYVVSTYLVGNALNYYNHSIEMHSSGKTYKEMMTTLYFLEDDLRNDSCYLNYAVELFYLNSKYIQQHIKTLSNYYTAKQGKGFFNINNYIKD